MNKAVFVIVLLTLVGGIFASMLYIQKAISLEPPETEWSRTYGGTSDDVAWAVVRTRDWGYAIAGWTESFGAGNEDVWLAKTDANGNAQWNRTYGSTAWERGYCLIQTADGGYAIAGETRPSASFYSNRDFWLVKTDANGNMEWNNTYGGTNQEEAYSVIQTGDMGYAIAGRTLSFGVSGHENMWLVKTYANGTMQWNEAYGGTGIEMAYTVIQTGDGGYAIGGETGAWSEERDMWLVKTDATGNMQWQKTYGLAGNIVEFSTSLIHTTDRGFALAGFREIVGGDSDFCLVKTDGDGNMLWDKTYGGATREVAWDAVQTSDGGYMLAGGTSWLSSPDLWLVKTDADGNMEWNQTYGGVGSEWAYSMVQTMDGGYATAGCTTSFGFGNYDFWLIKLAPTEIYATINVDPNTLNLKSKGKWITAYIELPEGYDAADINVSSILLNDTIPVDPSAPTSIGDYDSDGVPDLMVKFDRASVISHILGHIDLSKLNEGAVTITLTVTGMLNDGTPFEGSDTIRIIKGNGGGRNSYVK